MPIIQNHYPFILNGDRSKQSGEWAESEGEREREKQIKGERDEA